MSVDYSAQDFQHARSVIDAAAKKENVRVKKIGDTTIISEHRDPYSFCKLRHSYDTFLIFI